MATMYQVCMKTGNVTEVELRGISESGKTVWDKYGNARRVCTKDFKLFHHMRTAVIESNNVKNGDV